MSGRVLSTCPSLTNVGPEILADQPQPPRPVLRGRVSPQSHALDRADDTLKVERRDDVMVAIADQGRQNLPVPGKVSQMTDGFSQQGTRLSRLKRGVAGGSGAGTVRLVDLPARRRTSRWRPLA